MSLTDKDWKSRKEKRENGIRQLCTQFNILQIVKIYFIKLGLFDEDRSSKKSEIIRRKVTFCKESHYFQKIAWWSQKITYFVQPACLQLASANKMSNTNRKNIQHVQYFIN